MSQRKKESKKIKDLTAKVKQLSTKGKKKKKSTPFGDTGAIIGRSIGGMFGSKHMGNGVGRWLGTGIGSIFGSGDYTMSGSSPSYNVLTNGSQIPKFSSTHQTNIVCHREYLGDIPGGVSFTNTIYPLNPGVTTTFPWLASIAANYQEYKFHGLVFEFRPLITDFVTGGAPGVIVMATNYNADAPFYATKQQMENSEFAVSVKPTNTVMHGVECADKQTILPQRYVRTGAIPTGQDARLYDLGNFQFANQSNPSQNLGELWVSYCVEFFKPVLTPDVISGSIQAGHAVRSLITSASPLGSVGVSNIGSLTLYPTTTSVGWISEPGQKWMVSICWNGTSSAFTAPGTNVSGLTYEYDFVRSALNSFTAPLNGAVTNNATATFVLSSSQSNVGLVSIGFDTTGAYPGGTTTVDIFVSQVDVTI
jgi:hypothetical protein